MKKPKKKKKQRTTKQKIIDAILIIAIIALLGTAGYLFYRDRYPNNTPILKLQTQTANNSIDWDALLSKNSETVGWLKIEDTMIDTPVVQTSDNSKYLNTGFDGSWNERGVPFLDYQYVWGQSRNAVIYGHSGFRQSSGIRVPFDDLHNYANNPEYYGQHSVIYFYRPADKGGNAIYQIFSVIQVESNTDYRQLDFTDEESFVAYFTALKDASQVKTNITINPGDEIITLSTCTHESQFEDGRLAVIAKRIK